MGNVTLNDIRLKEYTLGDFPVLKNLKQKMMEKKASVCIERAYWVTDFLKNKSTDGEPFITRYAGAVKYFLQHKKEFFENEFDHNLLAGSTSSKPFGAPVYPEFTTGMTIWPELDTISDRKRNPLQLDRDDANTLNFEIYPYWMDRTILEYTRKKHNNPECMRLFERIVFYISSKAGCISHTVPDYKKALDKGVENIWQEADHKLKALGEPGDPEQKSQKEFYGAVKIAMEGVMNYAENLSKKAAALAKNEEDPWVRENYEKMSEVCARVPKKPARTFREAVNALWIIQVAIHGESINMAMSPGRLDQVLFPYYEDDIKNGRMTVKEALEIIGCLWLKLNDNTNLVPETADELFGGAGTVPAVTVGGVDEQGNDAVNDLTYLMLRATELLKTRDPNLNARYHYEHNSENYRNRVCEVIASTKAVPALHNDYKDILTLENQGYLPGHARDYSIIGCVELASSGRSYDASSSIILNLASVMEMTLNNGKRPVTGDEQIGPKTGDPATFESFNDFWEAFKTQLSWLIEKAVEMNEMFGRVYQEIMPSPLLSSFFEGPMAKGKDLIFGGATYNSSGATHIGFADTVDSLNAIEQGVFIDRQFTMRELMQALGDDFQGHDKIRAYLLNKAPKYGTQDNIAKKNAQNVVRFLYDRYNAKTNYRQGNYKPAFWTMTNHAGQGRLTGALPNGRKAYQNFASGFTPVSRVAKDLSGCFSAIGEISGLQIPGGVAVNMKFPSIETEEDIEKLGACVEAYFRQGGLQVQFNIMSYQDLMEARDNPKEHEDLLVRVSGYSAYFKDLNEYMKEEIITRTQYNIKTCKADPFPK